MKIIVGGKKYQTYEEAAFALGPDQHNIPESLPTQLIGTWEMFRDRNGLPVLIAYTWTGTVLEYYHAYYDEVQGIWRWQV